MATAAKPKGKRTLRRSEPLPHEMVKLLVNAADNAAFVAQQHAALLTPDARPYLAGAAKAAIATVRCFDFPPAIPLGGNIAIRLTDVAFDKPLVAAVGRLAAALEPYRGIATLVGGCAPSFAEFKLPDSRPKLRKLTAAVADVLKCLRADEVAAARAELAAIERERQHERDRRSNERAAMRERERRENGGLPRHYRSPTYRYAARKTEESNTAKFADGPPADATAMLGGHHKGKALPPATESKANPRWDRTRGILYFNDEQIKAIRTNQAPNVVKVLTAFEEDKWADEILDPLPHADEKKRKRRRRDTIASLNEGLTGIRFRAVQNGNGISWERTMA